VAISSVSARPSSPAREDDRGEQVDSGGRQCFASFACVQRRAADHRLRSLAILFIMRRISAVWHAAVPWLMLAGLVVTAGGLAYYAATGHIWIAIVGLALIFIPAISES
jgi:hypothetical protein